MKIISLDLGNGRDLYGMMKCEHCDTNARLSGGYNDAFWYEKVLPAFHCKECGKNRAGELRSNEVTARNRIEGGELMKSREQLLTEALQALLNMDVNGHALQDRLQFSDKGRALLKQVRAALGAAL